MFCIFTHFYTEKSMNYHQKNINHGDIAARGNVHIGDTTYINNDFTPREVKIPHRLTNNIPTNTDHILGRATELAQTKDHLAQHKATILFNGIGGIGKTALASKYMAIHGSEYKHLAWITVQSTLAEAFIHNAPLLQSLHITQQVQDYSERKQLDKAFEYLFHQLNLLEHTLVVIDNANDLDDLEQYKNWFDTANCHFLITSRSKPSEWATVEVDCLPEAEAVALFRKLHPFVSATDEAIQNLLSKLFYHTLLIELVAKAGANTGIPFVALQNMIDTKFIHDEQLNEDIVNTGKHGDNYKTKRAKIEEYIWLIFSQVKVLENDCKHLLKATVLLPVATPFDLDFLKKHFTFFNIPNAVVHLSTLTERGWLQKEQAEGQKPYFKMHPLIADVVKKHLELSAIFAESYINSVADLIYYDAQNIKHNLFEKNKNRPLANRLSELFFNENNAQVSELLHSLNWLNYNFGFYDKAEKYGERALVIAMNLTIKSVSLISKNQSTLAIVYRDLGKYEQAAELLEAALSTDMVNLGEEHPTVAIRQSNLANVYQKLGKYTQAAGLLENALLNFDKGHPKIALRQSKLANVYRNLGKYIQAAELLEASIASDLSNFNKEHPTIAVDQANLALVYQNLGKYEQAAELLEAALASNISNFGKEHPTVAVNQSNLANIYKDLGKYTKAMELLETALTSDLANFGGEYPDIALKQWNLATVYINTGRKLEATVLLQAAYQNFLKNLGATHPHTVEIQTWFPLCGMSY
jgi:tetratricopeptide (TPR) repeat protein